MKKAIVIGAGVMGLAAAFDLLKKGYNVDIFESDDRIGGMSSHFDFNGLDIERFYHFVCKPDRTMFEFLTELGIAEKLRWVPTKMSYFYNGIHYPWGNPVALLVFPELGMISKLRYGFHAFFSTKRSNWNKLDKKDAVQWLKWWIGEKAYNLLWKRLFELKFFDYTSNMSAAWIWTRIKRVGLSRKSLMQEELGYIEGGSNVLLKAFEDKIRDMGGVIHLNKSVDKIIIRNSKVQGIAAGQSEHRADIVISTIPLPLVPDMLDGADNDLIAKYRDVRNIPVVCAIVKLSENVTENFWLNVIDDRIDIPGVIEYSNLNPLDNKTKIAYIPFYMPDSHPDFKKEDDYFIRKSRDYLKMINPSLTDEKILDVCIFRYRYAQPICEPEYLKKLPDINPGIEGLYIADTSYYYPEDRSISESMRIGRLIANRVD